MWLRSWRCSPGSSLVVVLLFGGDSGTSTSCCFETGGQLVKGNQVLVGGQPIGTVDEPHPHRRRPGRGRRSPSTSRSTRAPRRSSARPRSPASRTATSRSRPGPNSDARAARRRHAQPENTTAPVDLDQLFNALDERDPDEPPEGDPGLGRRSTPATPRRRATAYKYFAPALQSTERLLAEVNRDQQTLLASSSSTAPTSLGAVAERRDDLSALTENANVALGAIAAENESLDRSLAALPPFLRQADTTFVNLRAALDDLDPLVETSKRATKDLPEFLADLRPLARERRARSSRDLRTAVAKPGRRQRPDRRPPARCRRSRRSRTTRRASRSRRWTRPRTTSSSPCPTCPSSSPSSPKLGQAAGYYDFDGHYLRVMPGALGTFYYNTGDRGARPDLQQPGRRCSTSSTSTPETRMTRTGSCAARARPRRPRRTARPPSCRRSIDGRLRSDRPAHPGGGAMRRIVAILAVGTTAGALVLFGTAAGGEEGTYEVRAIFDNGGFLVTGEEVRVAGAKVGSISEVDVTSADEAATADGSPTPGKAVVVLQIDDPAFQDFREDASLLHPPAVAAGREVRRVPAHRAARGRHRAAAGARGDPRGRARGGPAPAAAGEQRQGR